MDQIGFKLQIPLTVRNGCSKSDMFLFYKKISHTKYENMSKVTNYPGTLMRLSEFATLSAIFRCGGSFCCDSFVNVMFLWMIHLLLIIYRFQCTERERTCCDFLEYHDDAIGNTHCATQIFFLLDLATTGYCDSNRQTKIWHLINHL
ncbi:hypothetical protein KIL84_013975 [Mauremys mutica]|uniref:Uncharacterized protein n=1 Tax=Mauremys mutica TaxID=74926 RepID=A0A9D3WYP2_9SAUR|nr:hypothetical protein KIL84_013975 [Mauremys mutica]